MRKEFIKIREKSIESYFVRRVKEIGGFSIKYKSPDRILFYDGKAHLIELKTPGKKPRPLQVAVFKDFAKQGFTVAVLDNKIKVDIYLSILRITKELG